jgi:hypothetical protein
MRRNRLAAAAGVAALTLGATVAVADDTTDTQTVTITVEALARSITTDGAATISITAGEDVEEAVVAGNPTISYTNGSEAADIRADITAIGTVGSPTEFTVGSGGNESSVAVDANRLFTKFGAATRLYIDLDAASVEGAEKGLERYLNGSSAEDNGDLQFGDVITGIPTDVSRSEKEVVYSLGGDSPVTAGAFVVTVTFTIYG